MSKKLNNYRRTVQYLHKIYNCINEDYFGNELEEITLTVQESMGAYGHVTVSNTWFTEDNKAMKELNISANYLDRDITEIVTTLIHECCHIYNMQHEIQDVSGGYYHNKKFKKTAEEIGRIKIERHDKYGWTISTPTEETIDFCIRHELNDILIKRQDTFSFGGFLGTNGNGTPIPTTKPPKKPSSTRKYICPCCGNSFRATKDINVLCMDCNVQFVKAE